MNTSLSQSHRLLGVASLGIVVATLVWGLLLSGSPEYNRRVGFDRMRMGGLKSLRSRLVEYHRNERSFPDTLQSLKSDCCFGRSEIPHDPETEAPYEYRRLSETEFEVCAVFSEPSPEPMPRKSGRHYESIETEHPAGRFCLQGTAPKPNGTPP